MKICKKQLVAYLKLNKILNCEKGNLPPISLTETGLLKIAGIFQKLSILARFLKKNIWFNVNSIKSQKKTRTV